MNMNLVVWLLFTLVCLGLGSFGYGYERGVKDTEKRWADAVARKADRERTTP